MRLTTKQAAKGKWDGIIAQLLGEQAISRKHGPCPICGGKDRYRYDNKRNDGDWYCNVCGVGDGFRLITEALGIDFAGAARRIDRIVNNIEEKPFSERVDTGQRRQRLNEVWAGATNAMIAGDYLKSRGVPPWVLEKIKDVRGHPNLWYTDMSKAKLSSATYLPAMVALIRNSKGEPISIHRTYIGESVKEKKIMPAMETITGGCVRLGEPEKHLCIAEGIETALAAWAITSVPAWATISAHGMEEFKSLPRHVTSVIVCADNDASFTGQGAAFKCAHYLKYRLGVEDVQVWMPTLDGMDMLDMLNDPRELEMLKWRGK